MWIVDRKIITRELEFACRLPVYKRHLARMLKRFYKWLENGAISHQKIRKEWNQVKWSLSLDSGQWTLTIEKFQWKK